jgi:hypothetical protein
VANVHGDAQVPLPIPNDPSLVGYSLFTQGVWLDACGPLGFAATAGLAIRILP